MKNGGNVLRSVVTGVALAGAASGIQARTQVLADYLYGAYAPSPEMGKNVVCQPNKSDAQYHQRLTTARAVYARCDLANSATSATVWKIFSDFNLDGHLDKRDSGRISGNQLEKSLTDIETVMIAQGKEKEFYQNIARIMERSGMTIPSMQTKEDIVSALRANPELLEAFSVGVTSTLIEGIPLQYMFMYGDTASEKWESALSTIESHPEYGNLLAQVRAAEADLPKVLDNLLASGKISDATYQKSIVDLRERIDSGEIGNTLLAQALTFAPQLFGFYSSQHLQAGFQPQSQVALVPGQYKIRINMGAGVQQIDGASTIAVVTSIGWQYQATDATNISVTVGATSGSTGIVPLAILGIAHTLDADALAQAPLSDTTAKRTIGVSGGTSIVGPHIALGGTERRGETLNAKVKLAHDLLGQAFRCESTDTIETCIGRIEQFLASDAGKRLDILDVTALRKRLSLGQFDTAHPARKAQLIKYEKSLIEERYMEYLVKSSLGDTKASLDGVVLSRWGILPNGGITWLNAENPKDPIAQAHAHLLAPDTQKIVPHNQLADVLHVLRPFVKMNVRDGVLMLEARNFYMNFGDTPGPKNLTEELADNGIVIRSLMLNTRVTQNQMQIPLHGASLSIVSRYASQGWVLEITTLPRAGGDVGMISVENKTIIVPDKKTVATPGGFSIGGK